MNVGFLLDNAISKHPDKTAIIADDGRLSFRELGARVGRLSGAMSASGLKKGDNVALLFFNSLQFVETYFAAVKLGLVVNPVNFRLSGREIAYILNHSQSKAIFYGAEFEQTLTGIRDELETVSCFVATHGGDDCSAFAYERFLSSGERIAGRPGVAEDDPCQIMYTSGTTGRPKGVVLTHRNVLWNLYNTIYGREDREGQVSIIVGPLYHAAALNNHLAIQIALAGTSLLVRKFEPETVLRIIQDERATVISGSPAMYNMLMQHPAAQGYDTRSISKCTAGADKLLNETKRKLLQFFPNIDGIYDVYGCTEASPCITILNARDSMRKDVSVGKALPFLDARVVDEAGHALPPGEVGEIVCRGPNVMRGYHRDPEATARTVRDGWLHTGDLAFVDEEGFFYIVDRKKDMIVSGGENIYPREVEEILYLHPDIADAAVVGVADPFWGENVKAYVVLKPGAALTEEEVIRHCKKHLAGYKKPKEVAFLSEIPRNPSGKALKNQLRNMDSGSHG